MALVSSIQTTDGREVQELEIHGTDTASSVFECQEWVENIYRLDQDDFIEGGENGIDNRQAKQLGSRTQYLKGEVEALDRALTDLTSSDGTLANLTIDGVKLGSNLSSVRYVYCNTSGGTAEKAVTVDGFTLESGASLYVLFTVENTAVPTTANPITLNVNKLGAHPIYYRGTPLQLAGLIRKNTVLHVVYDASRSAWMAVGEIENPSDMRIQVTGAAESAPVSLAHGNTAQLEVTSFDASKASGGVLPVAFGGTGNTEGKAAALTSAHSIAGALFDGTDSVHNYFVCATAAARATKYAFMYGHESEAGTYTLHAGSVAHVLFQYTNKVSGDDILLDVQNTGAHGIRYGGRILNDTVNFLAGRVYSFIYDGSYWLLEGEYGCAPLSHANKSGVHGVGDASKYGHTRLSDTANAAHDATKGIAATPKMVANAINTAKAYSDGFLPKSGGDVSGAVSFGAAVRVESDSTAKNNNGVSATNLRLTVLPEDRYTGATNVHGLVGYDVIPFRFVSSKNSADTVPGLVLSGSGGMLMLASGNAHNYAAAAKLTGNEDSLVLASDTYLRMVVNAKNVTNQSVSSAKNVTLDASLSFYPGANKTGSIGASAYRWGSVYANTLDISGNALVAGSLTTKGSINASAGASIKGNTSVNGNLVLSATGNTLMVTTRGAKNATSLLSAVGFGISIPKESINDKATGPVTRYPFHIIGIKDGSTDIQPGFAITGNSGALVLSGGDAMARVMDDLDVIGQTEAVVVAADSNIFFGTNYASPQGGGTAQRVAVLDKSLNFYPKIHTGGNIGTSSSRWKGFWGESVDVTGHANIGGAVRSGAALSVKSSSVERGVAPGSDTYVGLASLQDKNNRSASGVNYVRYKNGNVKSYLFCYANDTSSKNVNIGCGYDAAGNWFTYAPTPATTDISDKIATTKFVKNYVDSQMIAPGFIMPYASNGAIPKGWLLCNGADVSRVTFAELFKVLGTIYGIGNGTTTFNLPNLVGRFLEGTAGSVGFVAAGLPNITGHFLGDNTQIGTSHENKVGGYLPPSGAFFMEQNLGRYDMHSDGDNAGGGLLGFNAARSSAVYGRSTTVQPASLRIRFLIKY